MENKTVHFLAFSIGILLLFHGFDKITHGTKFIENMIVNLYLPSSKQGVCGFCMGEFIQSTMFTGVYDSSMKEAKYIAYGAYIGEVVAPLFLIFGRFIRVASFIIIINMLVAIYLVYKEKIFTLTDQGAWSLELPMLYTLMALTVIFWRKDEV